MSKHKKPSKYLRSKLTCNLLTMRKKLGLTLRDVEKGTGIANASLSFWENGANVNLDNALIVARFFGCKVEDLWQLKDEK